MNPFKNKEENQPISPEQLPKYVANLEKKISSLEAELKEVKELSQKAITKVAVTRYNPFREIGGDQSFSAALLDEGNTGIIITSHYGRESNRVYGKTVTKGKSEHTLSEEEQKALDLAMQKT